MKLRTICSSCMLECCLLPRRLIGWLIVSCIHSLVPSRSCYFCIGRDGTLSGTLLDGAFDHVRTETNGGCKSKGSQQDISYSNDSLKQQSFFLWINGWMNCWMHESHAFINALVCLFVMPREFRFCLDCCNLLSRKQLMVRWLRFSHMYPSGAG